jgi:hypothetical protein
LHIARVLYQSGVHHGRYVGALRLEGSGGRHGVAHGCARHPKVNDGIVHFRPICSGAGWFHAKAREIVAHSRKTGRRGSGAEDEADTSAPVDGQLSLDNASE